MQLTSDNPGTRTECGGKERDVDADECELCGGGVECTVRCCITNGRNQVLANAHSQRTSQEQLASPKSVDAVESGERGDCVDDVRDNLEDEGARQLLDVSGEIRCAVVNDEVDTDKLLERLQNDTRDESLACRASKASALHRQKSA